MTNNKIFRTITISATILIVAASLFLSWQKQDKLIFFTFMGMVIIFLIFLFAGKFLDKQIKQRRKTIINVLEIMMVILLFFGFTSIGILYLML